MRYYAELRYYGSLEDGANDDIMDYIHNVFEGNSKKSAFKKAMNYHLDTFGFATKQYKINVFEKFRDNGFIESKMLESIVINNY